MKEHPILMSGALVRATLSGLKTQTRRLFKVRGPDGKSRPITSPNESVELGIDDRGATYLSTGGMSGPYPCPFGVVGDRLWVRETWTEAEGMLYYRATDREINEDERLDGMCWRPSIHMPRRASRLTLEVTSIRVERLQDIREEDARAEGIPYDGEPWATEQKWSDDGRLLWQLSNARGRFHLAWDFINGARAPWDSNPWIWAIDFQKVSP